MSIINTDYLMLYTEIISAHVDKYLVVMRFILFRFLCEIINKYC